MRQLELGCDVLGLSSSPELSPIPTARGASYQEKGKIFMTCVQSVLTNERGRIRRFKNKMMMMQPRQKTVVKLFIA